MDGLLWLMRCRSDKEAAAGVAAFAGNINQNRRCGTLLANAVAYGCLRTIAALGARGDCNPHIMTFHPDAPTICGTALHIAARPADDEDSSVLRALLAAFPKADVNVRVDLVGTPLHVAAKFASNTRSVRLLLNAGADPTVRLLGFSPAEIAGIPSIAAVLRRARHLTKWRARPRALWTAACVAVAEGFAEIKTPTVENAKRLCM